MDRIGLDPQSELLFRAATKGVGTFRVKNEEEEISALQEAAQEMDPLRLEQAILYWTLREKRG